MIQFRSEGIILDVQPDQDVTFTLDNPISVSYTHLTLPTIA